MYTIIETVSVFSISVSLFMDMIIIWWFHKVTSILFNRVFGFLETNTLYWFTQTMIFIKYIFKDSLYLLIPSKLILLFENNSERLVGSSEEDILLVYLVNPWHKTLYADRMLPPVFWVDLIGYIFLLSPVMTFFNFTVNELTRLPSVEILLRISLEETELSE